MTVEKPLRLPPEKDTPTETLSRSPFQPTYKTLPRTPPPQLRDPKLIATCQEFRP